MKRVVNDQTGETEVDQLSSIINSNLLLDSFQIEKMGDQEDR